MLVVIIVICWSSEYGDCCDDVGVRGLRWLWCHVIVIVVESLAGVASHPSSPSVEPVTGGDVHIKGQGLLVARWWAGLGGDGLRSPTGGEDYLLRWVIWQGYTLRCVVGYCVRSMISWLYCLLSYIDWVVLTPCCCFVKPAVIHSGMVSRLWQVIHLLSLGAVMGESPRWIRWHHHEL